VYKVFSRGKFLYVVLRGILIMGNRSSRPRHGQPDRAYLSGDWTLETSSRIGNEASGNGIGSDSERDCIDVQLIRVDATIQLTIALGDMAWLRGYEVFVQAGRLGDIPHRLRVEIENRTYTTGHIVNVDVPTVRFCSGQ
jgi:hypothetical protein